MKQILILVLKDFRLELRSREVLSVLFFLAIVLSILGSFGIESAFLNPETTRRLFPACFWGSFVVVASLSAGRAFEADFESRAIDACLLAQVSSMALFISKFISLVTVFLVGALFLLLVQSLFLNVAIGADISGLILVVFAVICPYAALTVILSALSSTSRLRGFLLPVLSLPLTVPLFLGGVELSSELLSSGRVAYGSPWFLLLATMFVVYVMVGVNVFEAVIKE